MRVFRDKNGKRIQQWDMLRYKRTFHGKHARIKNLLYSILVVDRTTLAMEEEDGELSFYRCTGFVQERYEVMGNTIDEPILLYEHHWLDKP